MDIYASDEEKAEEIKQWWRDNGRSVIIGCLLGAIAIFAGRFWFHYQDKQRINASHYYQQLVQLVQKGKSTQAQDITEKLLKEYTDTPYAVFAALDMAALAVKNKETQQAENYLRLAVKYADLAAHQSVANLRLARLYLNAADFDSFFALADTADTPAFHSLWEQLKGDAYVAQGKTAEARKAYQAAILSLQAGEPRQQILQIKLNDVAVADDA